MAWVPVVAGEGRRRGDDLRRGQALRGRGGHAAVLRPRRRGAALVSLEFLSPAASALARSPMEREALAAGARLEQRDGWNVAVGFDGDEAERERCRSSVGFADRSHLGKIELQADADGLDHRTAGPGDAAATTPGGARYVGRARARAVRAGRDAAALLEQPSQAGTGQRRRPDLRARRADDRGPARAGAVRALHRDRPAPRRHAGARLPARLGGAHARGDPARGARTAG